MLEKSRRSHAGLELYPLDWVSGRLGDASAIFAEMKSVPRWQTFRLKHVPEDLIGYQGASAYDLYSSRFRQATTHVETAVSLPHAAMRQSA